jgi:nucleotide-binding universal stress UspA family protein
MRRHPIVCGVDFSKASANALRRAATIARKHRRGLVVLFVEDPLLAAAARAARDRRGSRATTTTALERFVNRALRYVRRPSISRAIAIGEPADEILKAASRHSADLVVVGTRGIGRAARLLLGSTAEAVLRHTRVPVLAVPL